MFKNRREASRRTKEFKFLAGIRTPEELENASTRLHTDTGIGAGDLMEVGIRFYHEVDQRIQSDYSQVAEAVESTRTAVNSGELLMTDGKTPIQLSNPDDFDKMIDLALRWRPIAHMTISAGSRPRTLQTKTRSKHRPHEEGERHVWGGQDCIVCGKSIRFRSAGE
jgi:predicted secreted protein